MSARGLVFFALSLWLATDALRTDPARAMVDIEISRSPAGSPAEAPEKEKTIRVRHAKELLGDRYGTSVVSKGEKVDEVARLVHQWTLRNLKGKWKKHADRIAQTILDESLKYHFDPIFLVSVIEAESSFRPWIRGGHGELGLMQIKPTTAAWVAKRMNIPWSGKEDLGDPAVNIRIGAAYFAYLRERFDFHGGLYLAAYNMGAGKVEENLSKQRRPRTYPTRIMQVYFKYYRQLSAFAVAKDEKHEPARMPSS